MPYPLHVRSDADTVSGPHTFRDAVYRADSLAGTPRIVQARYNTPELSPDSFEIVDLFAGQVSGYWLTRDGNRSRRGGAMMGSQRTTVYTSDPLMTGSANNWYVIQPLQTDSEGNYPMPEFSAPRTCSNCYEEFDYDYEGTYSECCEYRCGGCGECSCDEYEHDDVSSYGVHDWSYKPDYRPKGRGGAMMGVELEVGGSQRTISGIVQDIDPDEDHLYMKEDGSISGVEIVTHPMTLGYAHAYPFLSLLDGLRRSYGTYVEDGYGLHVHVARASFRKSGRYQTLAPHQMTWLMFLYRNSRELQALARRTSERWASFRKPEKGELKRKAAFVTNDDRYVAINTNNRHTYELRFFASTLDSGEFYAAVEFTDASVEYTRNVKVHDILRGNALTWDRFTQWVKDQERYPNLEAELERIKTAGRPQGEPRSYLSLSDAIGLAGDGGELTSRTNGRYSVRWTAEAGWQLRGATGATPFSDRWHGLGLFNPAAVWTVSRASEPAF